MANPVDGVVENLRAGSSDQAQGRPKPDQPPDSAKTGSLPGLGAATRETVEPRIGPAGEKTLGGSCVVVFTAFFQCAFVGRAGVDLLEPGHGGGPRSAQATSRDGGFEREAHHDVGGGDLLAREPGA